MTRGLIYFALTLLAFAAVSATSAHAKSTKKEAPVTYQRAFDSLDKGKAELAYSYASRLRDPVLNKVLRAYYMAAPGNSAGFGEMDNFIRQNPDWPNLRDIRAIAEQKIPANTPPAQVVAWFTANPPITLSGFHRYIDALYATGQSQQAVELVRQRWINGDFRNDELSSFYTRFAAYLDRGDYWARLDRLLWANNAGEAKRLYNMVDPGLRAVADARLALASQKFGAANMLAHVPQDYQGEPGLLYERLRWLRKNNRDADAIDILEHAPSRLGKPEAWWDERNILVRRAIERNDYRLAYRLAADHSQTTARNILEAEFLAGWLALRYLNDPQRARTHFDALYQNASTPVSRARGAYWLGRAYEALNAKYEAEQAYETAASFNTTYYGQLALTRIYAKPIITALPEPAIPASVRQRFFSRDVVRAVERLHRIGEPGRARAFFKSVLDNADERVDFVLLSELAYQIKRPDLAIEAAKAANQKNILLAAGGFPVLDQRISSPPEPAFIHALIRQESMFNPDATSPAGAHGLMQLMPNTAKDVAKKHGMKFTRAKLGEPDYNIKLGTSFVQHQIDSFSGSYILALAGYNAGPSRVRQWLEEFGDPRDPRVDPIDWIERMPIPETRNYVQRILENLQVYRARLDGGRAQLLILKDLRR
ncbi:MAG: transglycosylase SLT domain-containing protein [Bdellovibrionales bacterium]